MIPYRKPAKRCSLKWEKRPEGRLSDSQLFLGWLISSAKLGVHARHDAHGPLGCGHHRPVDFRADDDLLPGAHPGRRSSILSGVSSILPSCVGGPSCRSACAYRTCAYSSSETGSSHSLLVFVPGTSIARCENHESGAAPCQCLTPVGTFTVLPGVSSTGSWPHSW